MFPERVLIGTASNGPIPGFWGVQGLGLGLDSFTIKGWPNVLDTDVKCPAYSISMYPAKRNQRFPVILLSDELY